MAASAAILPCFSTLAWQWGSLSSAEHGRTGLPRSCAADEVDAVLGHRRGHEHEVTTSLKTELLQLWDGLATREDANVLLMGATNRRQDLDAAVMRRSAFACACPWRM